MGGSSYKEKKAHPRRLYGLAAPYQHVVIKMENTQMYGEIQIDTGCTTASLEGLRVIQRTCLGYHWEKILVGKRESTK